MRKYFLIASILLLAAACTKTQPVVVTPTPVTPAPSPSPDPMANWQSYSSPQNGFSIKYPSDFGIETNYAALKTTSYIPVCQETMVGCVYYSGNAYKGTNFEAAAVSINILKTLNTEAKCYNFKVATNETQTSVADVTINGVVFKSATGGGAGAGHFSKAQSYRNFYNGKCYEAYQSVASTNIGNYEPGTIKEFNQDEVWQKLQEIVNTFTFSSSTSGGSSIKVNLGQEVKLNKNQVATFNGVNVSLKLTDFYYHPCPDGAQCFWSGLDVFFELTVDGKVYKKDAPAGALTGAPYEVTIKDSDYKTYAVFVVNVQNQTSTSSPIALPTKYDNKQYGFIFSLPADWKGFSVSTSEWLGCPLDGKDCSQPIHGPQIEIVNPKSTVKNLYEAIPIMVFTLEEWNEIQQEKLSVSAAPFGPSELGRNKNYVFALPPRYNYDLKTGYEQVEQIMQSNPLRGY